MSIDFAKLPANVIDYVISLRLSGVEHSLWLFFLKHDPFGNGWKDVPSPPEIASIMGCHLRSVNRAISRLEDLGLFEVGCSWSFGSPIKQWRCKNKLGVLSGQNFSTGKEIPAKTNLAHPGSLCPETNLKNSPIKAPNSFKEDQKNLKETNKHSLFVLEDGQGDNWQQLSCLESLEESKPEPLTSKRSINSEGELPGGAEVQGHVPPPALPNVAQAVTETALEEFSTGEVTPPSADPEPISTDPEVVRLLTEAEALGVRIDDEAFQATLRQHLEHLEQAIAYLKENGSRIYDPTRFLQKALARGHKLKAGPVTPLEAQFREWTLEAKQRTTNITHVTERDGQFRAYDRFNRCHNWLDLKDLPWEAVDRLCGLEEPESVPSNSKPDPSPHESTESSFNLSALLAAIDTHLQRLGWGKKKLRQFLIDHFKVKSQDLLLANQMLALEHLLRNLEPTPG